MPAGAAQRALATLGTVALGAIMLIGCTTPPSPPDRDPTSAEAYIHQVEQHARGSASPIQVYWANPPRDGETRLSDARTWHWSAPVQSTPEEGTDGSAVPAEGGAKPEESMPQSMP